ncbi:transcriptional regulator [Desertibacillus haloalkaliphilus]|uniref:transcriptional regulator n=1 Tax=Desertibacillus haloalkaliphilus TaxID=1328930 RepID=UPI001C26BEFB|nr:transcriptional regulator [Desertibacillus haloalkaliphilus]MBU8905588.1 transcriptional regulator [Desertibacillus haloalkaliphilus]
MFGLGKKRTKFGEWLDKNDIQQIDIQKEAKVGHGTMSRMCNEKEYKPKFSTFEKVRRSLKSKWGKKVEYDDFWM